MFYEAAQTIGPGWQRSYKPNHYNDMTWSPSSKHFRSPGSSPQSYRRINHPEDQDDYNKDDRFFERNSSPTFSRKVFRDVWDEPPSSNHRFGERPRIFKRVFKPTRWDDDDDFERTRSSVRQLARDFAPEFDSDFRHRDLKSNLEDKFEKAAGRVHHIPIMVERRLEEMKSKFGKNSPPSDSEEGQDEWQGPHVQKLKKNFEQDGEYNSAQNRHRVPRADVNKPRAFTSPIPTKWDPDNVHTLPTRKGGKNSKVKEDVQPPPKSVFRSYSETHEDLPKHQQQQQHAAAFRSHSDGHCPKTYVTKITLNVPPKPQSDDAVINGETQNEHEEFVNSSDCGNDGWDSHQCRQKTRPKERVIDESMDGADSSSKLSDDSSTVYENETASADEKSPKRTSLQQISSVLQNVEDLLVHVDGYNGTGRDKQYRFLDEMLTRCMLRLDDVDTEGREDVRIARKTAVMQVQGCIEKLEMKADECERRRQLEKAEGKSEVVDPGTKEPHEEKEMSETSNEQDSSTKPSDESKESEGVPEEDEQTKL